MKKTRRILIVDRKPKNVELLGNALMSKGYQYYPASTYQEMDELIDGDSPLDVVVMDLVGFDADIWDRCKKIHQRQIPFLILSTNPHQRLQQEGMQHGAQAIVNKPVLMNDFLNLLNSLFYG